MLAKMLAAVRAALFAGLASTAFLPAVSHAQAPADVSGWEGPRLEPDLAPMPADFTSTTRGEVRWDYAVDHADTAEDLMAAYDEAWPRIADDLGVDVEPELLIRIARNPEQMIALAPIGHPPPGYAVGVAYGRYGVVLLTITAPETWELADLERVLAHELSHIALHRAVRGRPIPRWFAEGLAIHQARENNLERIRTLWTATVAGTLIPLAELDSRFPERVHRVNVAYAESADIVGFLYEDEEGKDGLRNLVRAVRDGAPFEEAVAATYDESLASIESRWRKDLDERYHSLPLFFSGTGLWVLASLLLVAAYVRRRRRHHARLAALAIAEEREEKATVAPAAVPRPAPKADNDAFVWIPPDVSRESEVPTYEYEGRNHTLH
jgi:hypothetical protein